MLEILRAHGLDAGPTQRPLLAGSATGVLADLPAQAMLVVVGSLATLGQATGQPETVAGVVHCTAMAAGGALYGWLFQRAANDPQGGWLFGLAYAFLLWILGPIPVLQWLPDRPTLVGMPAAGPLLAQLLWGLVLGLVFPRVHRLLKADVDGRLPAALGGLGPEAATCRSRGLFSAGAHAHSHDTNAD